MLFKENHHKEIKTYNLKQFSENIQNEKNSKRKAPVPKIEPQHTTTSDKNGDVMGNGDVVAKDKTGDVMKKDKTDHISAEEAEAHVNNAFIGLEEDPDMGTTEL